MYRLNIYEKVKHFRETLAKSINESGLSAEVIHIVLSDYVEQIRKLEGNQPEVEKPDDHTDA